MRKSKPASMQQGEPQRSPATMRITKRGQSVSKATVKHPTLNVMFQIVSLPFTLTPKQTGPHHRAVKPRIRTPSTAYGFDGGGFPERGKEIKSPFEPFMSMNVPSNPEVIRDPLSAETKPKIRKPETGNSGNEWFAVQFSHIFMQSLQPHSPHPPTVCPHPKPNGG